MCKVTYQNLAKFVVFQALAASISCELKMSLTRDRMSTNSKAVHPGIFDSGVANFPRLFLNLLEIPGEI